MDVRNMIFESIDQCLLQNYSDYKASSDVINYQLRINIPINEINFQVERLDSLIRRFENKTILTLYRIVPLYVIENYNVGEIYCDSAFLSTSLDKLDKFRYIVDAQIAELRILCEAGTNMINMELNPQRSGNESEILLGRNSKFLITSKKEIIEYNDKLVYFDYDKKFAKATEKIVEFSLKTIV